MTWIVLSGESGSNKSKIIDVCVAVMELAYKRGRRGGVRVLVLRLLLPFIYIHMEYFTFVVIFPCGYLRAHGHAKQASLITRWEVVAQPCLLLRNGRVCALSEKTSAQLKLADAVGHLNAHWELGGLEARYACRGDPASRKTTFENRSRVPHPSAHTNLQRCRGLS